MAWHETLTAVDRVRAHTDIDVQSRLDEDLERRVAGYADASPDRIGVRLQELDAEWDIERYLEANASSLAAAGIVAGGLLSRRLLLIPLAVMLFLLQHAVQGWCPPLALFRRRGVRTRREIDLERYALKVLRGDLGDQQLAGQQRVASLLDAAARD